MRMTWADKLVALVSPRAAVRRLVARHALESYQKFGYDGARRGDRNGGWSTPGTSANAENSTALPTLRNRSRDEIRNAGIAKRARKEFATSLVGTGMTVTFSAKSAAVEKAVQKAWEESSTTLSADGLPTEAAMQSVGAKALFESGEYLIRRRWRRRRDGLRVPIQFQLLEPDLLDHLKTGPGESGNYFVNGVEFNAIGQRVAYWLHPQHPGDSFTAGVITSRFDSKSVPAEEISHVGVIDRPGQVRPVPHLHAVITRLKDRERLVEADLVRRAAEACVMAFVSQKEGDGLPVSSATGRRDDGARIEQLEPGMIIYGRDGETIDFNNPSSDGNFEADKRVFDRDIAAGLDIPYEILTGDFSQVNFAGFKAGLMRYKDVVEELQWTWFVPQHVAFIVREWMKAAELVGIFSPADEVSFDIQPPPFNLLDRLEELKADAAAVRSGLMDWGTAVARQGENPEAQLGRIAYWNKRFDDAGVRLDVDPRYLSAQGQQQKNVSNGTKDGANGKKV